MAQSKEVWVYAEQRGGQLFKVSLELLGKAAEIAEQLGAKLASILVGSKIAGLATELSAYGAEQVYLVDDPRLEYYQNDAYASAIADLVQQHQPEVFMLGATEIGEDLAPRIAAKICTGLTAHCVQLRIEESRGEPLLCQTVPGWGGGKRMDILCPKQRPQMVTVKPGVFELPARKDKKAKVIKISPQLGDKHFRAKTVEVKEERPAELALEEAETVVVAGWGINSLGSLKLVQELCDVLGGAVAGTRPMMDKGYIREERMIGQSGKTVSPELFISLGASGAMHFTTGFERAKFVLAVDQNPQAPIFQVADIGIVGDLAEVLPCLIEEFKKLKSAS